VQILAFKPSEFQPGWYVLRVQEISGTAVAGIKLTTPLRITEAKKATLVERPGASIDLANFSLSPWETLTVEFR
jgi:hypothetical protein